MFELGRPSKLPYNAFVFHQCSDVSSLFYLNNVKRRRVHFGAKSANANTANSVGVATTSYLEKVAREQMGPLRCTNMWPGG